MKRIFTLLALLPMFLWSCSENFIEQENPKQPINESRPDLTAAFADVATRTYVENDKYLRWHEDDRLSVFYGNTLNDQYKFKGQTGDNSGTFALVPSGELGTGNAFDRIYALYPYSETAKITDEGEISLTLPAVQNYAENSFGRSANTMIAVTENLEDTFLAFKNACGYLKLKLYDPDGGELKSIEVKGNNGEKIAGSATATIAFGEVPVLNMSDDATTTITIDCGDGIAIGQTAETATEIWVVLPETTFTKGLTIVVTDTNGSIFEKSTEKEVVIERNAVQPMAALNAEFVAPVVKPANNEIWYTATAKVKPRKTDVFGANIVSNEWDEATGEGVITFDDDVTMIGIDAFTMIGNLTSITIPNSVTKIGGAAFAMSPNLTSITIPNSVTEIGEKAFRGCSSLTSITIPDSVTSIGDEAFYRCTSLTSVTIGDSIATIGTYAFRDCSSLINITISSSITTIGSWAFAGCSSLPIIDNIRYADIYLVEVIDKTLTTYQIKEDTKLIGDDAFSGCSSLTSITIPDSVTTIGYCAFYNCDSLTSVTIPDSVTTIGDSAFSGCDSLESVTIPDSVTTIGGNAFYSCSSLTSVTIPDSVTTIEYGAFDGCSSLASITIPDSVTTIGGDAFENCSSLTSVVIGNSVTTIGWYAFSYCKSLTSIIIPDSVTTIGSYAFYNCDSLTSVTIPDSVTTIGERAFEYCSSLTSVTIPDSVTSIGKNAFCRMAVGSTITIGKGVLSIGESALDSAYKAIYFKPTTPPDGWIAVQLAYNAQDIFFEYGFFPEFYVPRESYDTYCQQAEAHAKEYDSHYTWVDLIIPYDFE